MTGIATLLSPWMVRLSRWLSVHDELILALWVNALPEDFFKPSCLMNMLRLGRIAHVMNCGAVMQSSVPSSHAASLRHHGKAR